ncbi:MAG: 2-oxoacid:ferredoxin oxidoreductase subunit beta, partial [Candidatus Omnitrophota bacterium]
NMYEYYDKRIYELKDHNPQDYNQALNKIREWDYNRDSPIALGAFYKKEIPTFEQRFLERNTGTVDRDTKIKDFLEASI